MPDINIDSITLSESSVGIGDEIIFEVCITNNGDRGDIELYTGFAYQDFVGGPALFLNGYMKQTIGDVIEGESFCPYGEISVTQEVTDAKKSGKDVKFWALAVPGNSLSKSINIEIPKPGRIYCSSFPTGASIYLNGTNTGETTNVVVRNLEPGYYDVKFTLAGYEDYIKENVLVEAGIEAFISKELVPAQQQVLTSLGIVIYPSRIGVGQESTITGHLVIADVAYILPGIPVKLYLNKGQGFTYIATLNTPANGLGQFEYYYEAISSDADKTLEFKWIYEGGHEVVVDGENVSLVSSESDILPLLIETGIVLEETAIELSAIPDTDVEPKTTIQLTAYLIDFLGNPLPHDSFVEFYKNDELLIIGGTIDGYANYNYVSITEDSEQTVIFKAKYLGIENVYDSSEDTTNVSFTEYIQPQFGEIGVITYNIIKGTMAADQIEFNIPVTNTSDVERCYYVDLYDKDGEHVDKAPETILPLGKFAQKIKAGETENIVMTSVGDWWIFEEIVGQLLTFKLMTDNLLVPIVGACSDVTVTYELAHEVTVDMSNTDIIVSVCADNTEGLVTKDLQIGLLYCDPTHLTKTDVCLSPIDIINITNEEHCTSYPRPGPFTCSGNAYHADSKFVAYARGFDDEDNEYVVTSPVFKSIYGTKHITVKITGEPIEECFIDHPFDPTKCLITNDQWTFIKWTAIGLGSLYVTSVAAPMIKGIGTTLEKSQKYKREK